MKYYRHKNIKIPVKRFALVTGRMKFINYLLNYFGFNVFLCREVIDIERGVETQEILDINIGVIANEIRDQLYWAKSQHINPTKLIIGRQQYEDLMRTAPMSDFNFESYRIPSGTPFFQGLELVLNPCFDGVAIG